MVDEWTEMSPRTIPGYGPNFATGYFYMASSYFIMVSVSITLGPDPSLSADLPVSLPDSQSVLPSMLPAYRHREASIVFRIKPKIPSLAR